MNIENLDLEVSDSVFERIETFIESNEILNPKTVKHKILIDKFKEDDLKSQFTVAVILFFSSLDKANKKKSHTKDLSKNIGFALETFKKCADKNHCPSAYLYASLMREDISEQAHYLKIAIKSNPDHIEAREQLKLYYKNMNSEQNPVSKKEFEQILFNQQN